MFEERTHAALNEPLEQFASQAVWGHAREHRINNSDYATVLEPSPASHSPARRALEPAETHLSLLEQGPGGGHGLKRRRMQEGAAEKACANYRCHRQTRQVRTVRRYEIRHGLGQWLGQMKPTLDSLQDRQRSAADL